MVLSDAEAGDRSHVARADADAAAQCASQPQNRTDRPQGGVTHLTSLALVWIVITPIAPRMPSICVQGNTP